MILTALLGLSGCTAGGEPVTECAGSKCDDPNSDAPGEEGEAQYESGYYDARFDPEFSIVCEGGDVDPAGLQPGLEALASEPSPLEDGPIRIVRLLDAMRLEGEPCDTDGPSFRCVETHETIEVEEGLTLELIGAIVGEWSALDTIAGRAGAEISCAGEHCDVLAEFSGLTGPEGEPRSFPCSFGWSFDAEHIGHELPESE